MSSAKSNGRLTQTLGLHAHTPSWGFACTITQIRRPRALGLTVLACEPGIFRLYSFSSASWFPPCRCDSGFAWSHCVLDLAKANFRSKRKKQYHQQPHRVPKNFLRPRVALRELCHLRLLARARMNWGSEHANKKTQDWEIQVHWLRQRVL